MKRIIISLCALFLQLAQAQDALVVNLNQGPVRGYRVTDSNGDYFAFYGIPYATAPTGVHKFKAPMPPPFWTETLDAVNRFIYCPQNSDSFSLIPIPVDVREDCLVANVFVPDTNVTNLPVVVTVHGGAYQIGSGNMFSPDPLVTRGNIIAVSFNYRLGVHGFLCLGTDGVPGNAGMKDMVALLRWVQTNIARFGGNPDDVTLDGFSAGSSAAEHLLLSESARGLFNKVIPESGSAIAPYAVMHDPIEIAKSLARTLNFISDDVYALEEFYQTAPLDLLTADAFIHIPNSTFMFVPCIERDTGIERFLKENPYNVLLTGNYNKLPVLYGIAAKEGLLRMDIFDEWAELMNEKFSDFLPADLEFENEEEKESVAAMVKEFYFGDQPVSDDTVENYVEYFGDVMFAYPTLLSTRLQVNAGSNAIFLYNFSFYDETSRIDIPPPRLHVDGAGHTAQTFAIFNFGLIPESEEFAEMREMMRQLWINFIKTGNTVPEGSSVIPEPWPPVTANLSPHMNLDRNSTLQGVMIPERAALWDGIYARYRRQPIPPPTPIRSGSSITSQLDKILFLAFLSYYFYLFNKY